VRHVHVFRLRPEPGRPAANPSRPEAAPEPVRPAAAARAGFSESSSPYVFGTENLTGVLGALDVRGKRVLTVLGGADQLLNFACNGAREVRGFDISRAASHMAELKCAALRAFDRGRYLSLLLDLQAGPSPATKGALADLLLGLSPAAAGYFQDVLSQGFRPKVRIRKAEVLQRINPYLQSDEAYLRTRENLPQGPFVTADLFALAGQLRGPFDVIYAANVLDFNRAQSEEAMAALWPLAAEDGVVCSYEFASHPRRDGEYGPGVLRRHAFDGPVYGGRRPRNCSCRPRRWWPRRFCRKASVALTPSRRGCARR
jgi:hypothetical protein